MPIFTTLGAACAKAWGFTSGLITDQYFNLVSLLLPGNGTNGANNNTFLDSSGQNGGAGWTITRNPTSGPNAPTQGTFSPFSQTGWGNYFNGSANYRLTIPDSTDLDIPGDFCLEMWVYITSSGTNQLVCLGSESAAQNGFILYNPSSSEIALYTNGSTAITTSGAGITANRWYHIALVRNGVGAGNTVIYVDGVSRGSAQITTSFTGLAGNGLSIGQTYSGSYGGVLNAYLSNVRLVNGSPVYTGAFTPPTTPLTAITNTKLLTCQSNRFVDANTQVAAKTITVTGSPSVTPFSPFAPTAAYSAAAVGGSGYFDGNTDYLDSIGTAADWAFMSNSTALWSLECWLFVSASTEQAIIDTTAGSSANVGVYVAKTTSNTILVDITRGVAGTRVATGTTTGALTPNAWNHLLVSYDQSLSTQNFKVYINGGSAETFNKTANAPSGSNPTYSLRVGGYNATSTLTWNGYISSLRISNVVRSSSVPTTPYSSDANTKLLLNFTNAGVVDATAKNVLETVGNAQISTGAAKFGTTSIYFDGDGDQLVFPASPLNAFGTGDFTIEFWAYSLDSGSSLRGIIDNRPASAGPNGLMFRENSGGFLLLSSTSGNIITTTTGRTANVWQHIALVRASGTFKLYVNALFQTSATPASNDLNSQNLKISGFVDTAASPYAYYGYLSNFRITKFARYSGTSTSTANFTLPTAPFPVQ